LLVVVRLPGPQRLVAFAMRPRLAQQRSRHQRVAWRGGGQLDRLRPGAFAGEFHKDIVW